MMIIVIMGISGFVGWRVIEYLDQNTKWDFLWVFLSGFVVFFMLGTILSFLLGVAEGNYLGLT